MFRRIINLNALLLAGCILFAGCAGRPAEEDIPGSAGSRENANVAAENDGGNTAQDGAGQDMSAPGVAGRPDGTAQMPEGNGEASGTDGAGLAQEDKKPRPEVGEKKLHLDMYSKIKVVDGDKLLVYGNKEILLLDMYTLDVLKRADNEAYGNIFSISTLCRREDGSCIIGGMLRDKEGSGKKTSSVMITYDSDLQAGGVLDLVETFCPEYEGWINSYEFLDNGRKLLYSLTLHPKKCFYIYDFQSGEITEIVSQSDMLVGNFLYLESVDQILYVGLYGDNQRALVRMDMDGQILETNVEHRYGGMWDFQDFVLISESVPAGEKGEGAFFYYDIKDGSVRSFPFADKGDSDAAEIISSRGKYFAAWQELPDKEIPYKLHMYSSEDGRLICEIQLSSEEFGEGFILRSIYIDDETERMILYGTWAGRSLETWIVSKDLFE